MTSIPYRSDSYTFPRRILGMPELVFRWIFIAFFAVVFPIVFLQQKIAIELHWLKFSLPFGLLYSGVLVHVILFISRKFKSKLTSFDDDGLKRLIRNQLLTEVTATVLFATLMGVILSILDERRFFSVGLIARNIAGSLLVVGILIGVYDGLYWLNQFKRSLSEQEKLRRMNVQGQLEVLREQVKPHFLFNSLNTLVGIIPEDSDMAVEFVENLSKVYRYILEIKDRSLIPLEDEISCVRAYLFLLQIRFGSNLEATIEVDKLNDDQHVVPLCLQLLVENAVKHNVVSKAKPLQLSIVQQDNCLEVKNNIQLKDQVMDGTGTGLSNIRSRYRLLAHRQVIVTQVNGWFSVQVPIIQVAGA